MKATQDRLARIALGRLVEPGDPRVLSLVTSLGAARVLSALKEQARLPDVGEGLAGRLRDLDPERDLAEGMRQGFRFVIPGDPEWPCQLDELEQAGDWLQRGRVPVGLWLRGGGDLAAITRRAVAIVGSRSATVYGTTVAADLAYGVAKAGHGVVSGAAFGIDQAAHRGALAAGEATVAVLACGVDRAYPMAHRELLAAIAVNGVVVSEAPMGGAPTKVRFLARNRLIAALGTGTVVVEAAIRSGALNTATWTERLSRTLMGVPGPITSASSAGVHQMMRGRGALVVTSAEEVQEAISPSGSAMLAEPREPRQARDLLTPVQQQVLDAVPVAHPADSVSIARTAGLSRASVEESLTLLCGQGLVVVQHSKYRLRPEDDEVRAVSAAN